MSAHVNPAHPASRPYRCRRSVADGGLWLAWRDLLSVEASFVLFLFSGRYKMMPELRGSPIDYTVLFLVMTVALIVGGFASGRLRLPSLGVAGICFLLFTEFVAISLFWSSLGPLNLDKLQRFLIVTAPSFYIAAILCEDPVRRLRMLRLIVWFSLAFVGRYYYYRFVVGIDLISIDSDSAIRLSPDTNTYLDYSSHAEILFTAFFASAIYRSWRNFCLGFAGMAGALLALADMGGRGPLAMAILTLPLAALMLMVRRYGFGPRFLRLSLVVGLLCAGGLLAITTASITNSQFRTIDRYELQLSNEDTSSMDERKQGQALAYTMWLQRPLFGWGIGEFRVWDSYLNYPHNLVLEILTELGIIGCALFVAVVAAAIIRCVGHMSRADWNWVDATYAFLFLTELVTHSTVQGYLAEDRVFFSYLAVNLVMWSGPGSQQVRS